MRRTILGLVVATYDDWAGAIESTAGGQWAIDVEESLTYLDDVSNIQHGHAAEYRTVERERPEIHGDTIEFVDEEVGVRAATEFFADVEDAGFVAVDSSDGMFLFEKLLVSHGVDVIRAEIDLVAWAEQLDAKNAEFWQVGWSEENADGDTVDAGVAYHNIRDYDPMQRPTSQLGFRYSRPADGKTIRGTAAASGYVELYQPTGWGAEEMARWLRDELLPFAFIPDPDTTESEQSTLDATSECVECGNETVHGTLDGDPLCVVHYDGRQEDAAGEQGSLDELEAALDGDGE